MCKLSVIIPVYNVESYLADCLESVLSQDFQDMEILCVDDGSTDGSREILRRYAEKDSRIQMICYEQNCGPAYARNQALMQATGEYVFFLDSDDMIPTGALSKLYLIASRDDLDAVMYEFERFYESGFEQDQVLFSTRQIHPFQGIGTGAQLLENVLLHDELEFTACTGLWRRQMFVDYRLVFHDGILHEDIPFAVQALLLARRVRFLPDVCYLYRRRAASIMTTKFGWENLRGDLLGTADIAQFVLAHGIELPKGAVRTACRFLMRMQNATHRLINRIGVDVVSTHARESAAEEMIYRFALQNGNHFVKGYLTSVEQQRLREEKDIIIYGVGCIGMEVMRILEDYGIRNYHLAVTKKKDAQARGLMEIVQEIGAYQSLRDTALVIISAGMRFRDEMVETAYHLGFRRVVSYFEMM